MTTKDALEYLKEIMDETDARTQELADLIIWAYDKGAHEALEDYAINPIT
ncbi:MAG TPA: hypothetical protein VGJ00_10430 [Rhabdochlamydiaceae bacterium]|jgi:hypothetical protein